MTNIGLGNAAKILNGMSWIVHLSPTQIQDYPLMIV